MFTKTRSVDISTSDITSTEFKSIELRIDKLNSTKNEWTQILIPIEVLPLQEGIQYEIRPPFTDDPAFLTYSNKVLKYDYKNYSNFTNDITTIEISPDLSVVGEITYLRKGLGFAGLIDLITKEENLIALDPFLLRFYNAFRNIMGSILHKNQSLV